MRSHESRPSARKKPRQDAGPRAHGREPERGPKSRLKLTPAGGADQREVVHRLLAVEVFGQSRCF
jgi:hypothetical protein